MPSEPETGGERALEPVTVVTGGSEGIGFAIAARLAGSGARVLLVARSAARLRQAAGMIGERAGARVDWLALDITAPDAGPRIGQAVAEAGGYVDRLVNSAGIGLAGDFARQPPESIERLLQLNIVALTRLMRHFLPGMRERRRGGILNVASLGGYVPGPQQAAYYASKAYVISFTEAVAAEVAWEGVRVTVSAPGPVATLFHDRMGAMGSLYRLLVPFQSPALVARWSLLGWRLGARVIVPGIFTTFFAVGLRLMPHRLVMPIIRWLLVPRGREARNA